MDKQYLSRPDDGVIRAAGAIDAVLAKFDGRHAGYVPDGVYLDAAVAVAISAMVIEKVRTDPTYVAGRGVREDALRRKAFEVAMARFEAASAALRARWAVSS